MEGLVKVGKYIFEYTFAGYSRVGIGRCHVNITVL